MARTKASDKQEEAPPPPPRTVSIEEFITTRDRVVNGLSSLQFAIASLLNAYLDHCKTLVGDAGVTINAFNPAAPAVDAAFAAKADKKKKIKKERDPNAPKRPLTAAFLYSQHARPVVKHDLEEELKAGDKLAPNAVNEEVNRRWNALDDDSKQQWKDQYKKNLETYKVDAAEYEATKKATAEKDLADAEEMDEDVVSGAANVESDADGSSDEEPSLREPSSPPKAPTPPPASATKGAKRRKTTKENGVAVSSGTEVPLPGLSSTRASAVPLPGASANTSEKPAGRKTPAKKGKAVESPLATKSRARKSKADEEASVVEPAPEPEKKGGKRKRKAEA